jgi:hypothetical protein
MSTTILALALGDDHLILNGGAWQILSGQNIYFQLLLVLKEINFILHIRTNVYYAIKGRPFDSEGRGLVDFVNKYSGPKSLKIKILAIVP